MTFVFKTLEIPINQTWPSQYPITHIFMSWRPEYAKYSDSASEHARYLRSENGFKYQRVLFSTCQKLKQSNIYFWNNRCLKCCTIMYIILVCDYKVQVMSTRPLACKLQGGHFSLLILQCLLNTSILFIHF